MKTDRTWAIKESLGPLWNYRYPKNGQKYFKRWYFWATHSTLRPVIEAAKTLKRRLSNILTYFRDPCPPSRRGITPCLPPGRNAVTERLNSKMQMIQQMVCGFRNRGHYHKVILFQCGGLDLYARVPTQPGSLVHTTISCMTHGKL